MFELECCNVQEIRTKDDRVFYRVWFNLPDGSLAWLISNKKYFAGDKVPIRVYAFTSQDVKTNMRLSLTIG